MGSECMNKRTVPLGQRTGPGPRQARPELEVLEDRVAPVALQAATASPVDVRDSTNQGPKAAASPIAPTTPLAAGTVPAGAALASSGERVFSTPSALNPLLVQIGRFHEPLLELPPSGGSHELAPAPELAALLSPVPEPGPAEETAAVPDDSIWCV